MTKDSPLKAARPRTFQGVLFDLDGTLVDTRQDITLSVNHTMAGLGRQLLSSEEVTSYIGDGVTELLKSSLKTTDDALIARALGLFRTHYTAHCSDHAVLYPGVKETLQWLGREKRFAGRLGVVTNKPARESDIVLTKLGVRAFFEIVIAGDSLSTRKPSPVPMLEAARALSVSPQNVLMVGDSANDMSAARAAEMPVCAVTYGFRPRAELMAYAPDYVVDNFSQIQEILL